MQIDNNIFTGRRHNDDIPVVHWHNVGMCDCPPVQTLIVKRFTKRSVVFEDINTGLKYYASLRMGNKVLLAQQGLCSLFFVCAKKASDNGQECTWIGEIVY